MKYHCKNYSYELICVVIFYFVFTGGAPNRPLPPTPDEEESGDRTLVMKRVSDCRLIMRKRKLQVNVTFFSAFLSFSMCIDNEIRIDRSSYSV